ncbi:MAG: Smr/MutS family protein [Firmicutes bacterium]|nr:Smr/MutS family protein [Bacillota bacterium]
MSAIITIDLHGYDSEQARFKLTTGLNNALNYGERVVRIIHGQGKHSEVFPVIKSMVRHWLEESELAKEIVESVFRGEDGSPYTAPNPGETIVVLKSPNNNDFEPQLSYDEEEEREARRNLKKIRAAKRHSTRRRY